MPKTDELIKIPVSPSYLRRQRINDLLLESVQKPLTTVTAGAGYGKTQAVYTFLQEQNLLTVWLQITSFDNRYNGFWDSFIRAISPKNKILADVLEKYGFPETPTAIDRFLSIISDTVKFDNKCILVFDDFYLIYDLKILRFIEKLVYANIPNLSIIIISRNEPEINTAGLISKELISTITEYDLCFLKEEIIEYFQMQDLYPSPEMISNIYNATGGWIFAIHLIGLSMKKGLLHEEYALNAMRSNIFKLMESEIFSVISDELKSFLIKLSLLDDLPLELINEICFGNDNLISEMAKLSSFIRFDSYLNTYLIHNLFLEFLSQKQELLTDAEKNETYLKSARWCAQNGYKMDAIAYYEKAGNYAAILNIAYTFSFAMPNDASIYILDIMNKAPKEIFDKYPHAYTVKTRAMFNLGYLDEAEAELKTVIQKYEAYPPSKHKSRLLLGCYTNMGFVAMNKSISTHAYDFHTYFEKGDYYFPSSGYMAKGPMSSFALSPYVCMVGSPDKGEMERYIDAVAKSAPHAANSLNGCMYGLDDLCTAEYSFFQNNIKYAEEHTSHSLYKAREKGQHEIESRALFLLLRINVAAGNYAKVRDILTQLDLQLERIRYPNSHTIHEIITGWFYSSIRHTEKVPGWIKSDFDKSDLSVVIFGQEDLVKTKYLLIEKQYHELLTFIGIHENKRGICDFLFGRIVVLILKSIALYNTGEKEEAVQVLQEAYTLAAPNSLDMLFIEYGNAIRTLSREALKSEKCTIPREWLEQINKKSSTYAKKLAYIIACYRESYNLGSDVSLSFTAKETEILTDMCHGLSRTEIASYRNLSVNTVKNMTQTIYLKLGADNTKDAIRIASQLGLLN